MARHTDNNNDLILIEQLAKIGIKPLYFSSEDSPEMQAKYRRWEQELRQGRKKK